MKPRRTQTSERNSYEPEKKPNAGYFEREAAMEKSNSKKILIKRGEEKLKLIKNLVQQVEEEYQLNLLEEMVRQAEKSIYKDKLIKQVEEELKLNDKDETILSINEESRRTIQHEQYIQDEIKDLYIYIQDPMVAQKDNMLGIQPIRLLREPCLGDGPTSARLVVFDFDIDKGGCNPAAAWKEKEKRFETSEGKILDENCADHFQFHQVNAWAIVQYLLTLFEGPEVFGRLIPWGFAGSRLIIVPHAGFTPNAYYDRASKSLQFYYLGDPEKAVYNCLSFDVVAHEAGHALLDGIRPYYYEFTSLQTAAFHEFFADITAMLGGLRNNVLRRRTAKITRGDLGIDNVITHLAEQFGNEVHHTDELRNLASKLKMSDIENISIPHDCSLVLTGAIFELLKLIVDNYKSTALDKLWRGVERILRLTFQPVDFLPPVDVQFIDYARAMLFSFQADVSNKQSPDYQFYEDKIKEVFQKRGLDLSNLPHCPNLQFTMLADRRFWSRTSLYSFIHQHRAVLHIPQKQDFQVVDVYQAIKYNREHKANVCHIVVQYIWSENIPLTEERYGPLKDKVIELWCGGTLVFDAEGNLVSWMHKPGLEFLADKVEGESRKKALLEHIASQVAAGRVGLEQDEEVQINGPWTPGVVASSRDGKMHLEISQTVQKTLDTADEEGAQEFPFNFRNIL